MESDAVRRALAEMDLRALELVAKWRAEDAAKRVRFHAPQWPGRAPRRPQGEPPDYWSAKPR